MENDDAFPISGLVGPDETLMGNAIRHCRHLVSYRFIPNDRSYLAKMLDGFINHEPRSHIKYRFMSLIFVSIILSGERRLLASAVRPLFVGHGRWTAHGRCQMLSHLLVMGAANSFDPCLARHMRDAKRGSKRRRDRRSCCSRRHQCFSTPILYV